MNNNITPQYEGYLWWSDSSLPVIYDGSTTLPITFDKKFSTLLSPDSAANPFIVEGNLWDAANRVSIYIKYVDGKHLVRKKDLKLTEASGDFEYTEVTYAPHRMDGISGLKFRQYWKAESDPLCEEMEALQPAMLTFVGFEK